MTALRYEDVTADITLNTAVFPGDPSFETEEIVAIGANSPFKLDKMSLYKHTGTHVDFPAHVIEAGKTSSDYSLDDLIMNGMIVEAPRTLDTITADFVENLSLLQASCIFFKTRNSEISKQTQCTTDYVFIEPQAAKAPLNKNVKAAGIDYISVDGPNAEDLPVRKLLLGNNVLIVENLELQGIEPGLCHVYIMPPKIPDMDDLLQ